MIIAIKRLVQEEQFLLGKVKSVHYFAILHLCHLICIWVKGVLLEIQSALFPYEVINIIISYCGSRLVLSFPNVIHTSI
jgi:hypothetical protein